MALVSKTKTWADNDLVNYTDLNANFDSLYNEVNGDLDNANISASASIAPTKIDGTALVLSGAQTVTGKKTFGATVQTLTTASDGSTVTFNLGLGNLHEVELGGNRTLALSNVSTGQCFVIKLIQDATGSRTVTWFSGINWPGDDAPTLTTTAEHWDTFGFICTGSGTYDAHIIGQDYQ